jgi:3-mercaptopyruvate sulfurtransferase SseA
MRHIFSLLAIMGIALAVLTACNSAERRAANPASGAAPSASIPADGVRRITVAELRDLLNRNEAMVVDVRNEQSYKAGHIRGAKLIPVEQTLNHVSELPKDKLIVTYCS